MSEPNLPTQPKNRTSPVSNSQKPSLPQPTVRWPISSPSDAEPTRQFNEAEAGAHIRALRRAVNELQTRVILLEARLAGSPPA